MEAPRPPELLAQFNCLLERLADIATPMLLDEPRPVGLLFIRDTYLQ